MVKSASFYLFLFLNEINLKTVYPFRKVEKSVKFVERRGKSKNGHKMSIYKPIFFIYGLNYLFRCTNLKKEGRRHRGFSSTHTFFGNPVGSIGWARAVSAVPLPKSDFQHIKKIPGCKAYQHDKCVHQKSSGYLKAFKSYPFYRVFWKISIRRLFGWLGQ